MIPVPRLSRPHFVLTKTIIVSILSILCLTRVVVVLRSPAEKIINNGTQDEESSVLAAIPPLKDFDWWANLQIRSTSPLIIELGKFISEEERLYLMRLSQVIVKNSLRLGSSFDGLIYERFFSPLRAAGATTATGTNSTAGSTTRTPESQDHYHIASDDDAIPVNPALRHSYCFTRDWFYYAREKLTQWFGEYGSWFGFTLLSWKPGGTFSLHKCRVAQEIAESDPIVLRVQRRMMHVILQIFPPPILQEAAGDSAKNNWVSDSQYSLDLDHMGTASFYLYEPGGRFDTHNDFPYPFQGSLMNYRLISFFVYLNSVAEGGETVFPNLVESHGPDSESLLRIQPVAGKAVVWGNTPLDDPTQSDAGANHAGAPVGPGSVKHMFGVHIHNVRMRGEPQSFWDEIRAFLLNIAFGKMWTAIFGWEDVQEQLWVKEVKSVMRASIGRGALGNKVNTTTLADLSEGAVSLEAGRYGEQDVVEDGLQTGSVIVGDVVDTPSVNRHIEL